MQPTRDLIDEIYRQRVRRAREMAPEEKLRAGGQLFELACRVTLSGIRNQHPDVDEATASRILADRLALRRKLEAAR